MGFVIYDLETTGLKPRFDQIVQFAAVHTDENLNTLEKVAFEGRLRPHILPSPRALHVTRARYRDLIDPQRSSYDAMVGAIRETMDRWTPSMFIGFNSISYDDELLRQAFYESLRPPFFVTNMGGNSRGDLLKLARVVGTLQPNILKTVRDDNGRRVFRLAELAQANGIDPGRSHRATADVETTLALCRLVAAGAPVLWSSFMRFASKSEVLSFIAEHAAFAVFEFKKGLQDVHAVTSIGAKPSDANVRYCLDLTADLSSLRRMTPADLRIEVAKSDGPIFRMKANGSPILAELWDVDLDLIGDFSEPELEDAAAAVRSDDAFVERLLDAAVATETVWPRSEYVELRIYDGFISSSDEETCRQFHRASWTDRLALANRLQDARLKMLARRLVYFERPDVLDKGIRAQMDKTVRDRLNGMHPDAPCRTFASALEELEGLEAEAGAITPELAHYREYLQSQLIPET